VFPLEFSTRLAALLACALLATPAWGAEVTRVATSAEENNPFELDFTVRYERGQKKAKVTREFVDATANVPFGATRNENELWYERVTNQVVARAAVGLYHDLELHAELPYVLGDNSTWSYTADSQRSIQLNGLTPGGACQPGQTDPSTQQCLTTSPIFPVGTGQSVFHGGRLGDVSFGLAWGILSDRRDDYVPFWLVAFDVTAPTAERYDPGAGRDPLAFTSPYNLSTNQGPFGHKVWTYDLQTAISKRMGPLDPYVRAHVKLSQKSSQTYENCLHSQDLAALGQARSGLPGCDDPAWKDTATKPPHVAGLELGTELVPYEDKVAHQRFAIDLRLGGEYTTQSRWYNELTDATGKLLWTDPYVTFRALAGLYLRASAYVQLRAVASLAHEFTHFISGEPMGKTPGDAVTPGSNGEVPNPNFDWRYDAPGRRFRVSQTTVFDLTLAGVINF
jgi:hypothetical protein